MEFLREQPISKTGSIDIRAVCVFLTTGMFLGGDTYFEDLKVAAPGTDYRVDPSGRVTNRATRFSWFSRSGSETEERGEHLDKFEALLDRACGVAGRLVVALSGGLDSRTIAASLANSQRQVSSYSYSFEGGEDERRFGREVGGICDFRHRELGIPSGYLWDRLDRLSNATACYSEFTHPRQMAVIDAVDRMGDTLCLGHWGDVLFDGFGMPLDFSFDRLCEVAFSRFVKREGLDLANEVWREHFSDEDFETTLRNRFRSGLEQIEIEDPNARLRAFKSLNWAPRWTSVNLSIFRLAGSLVVPYYSDEMCQFICETPEPLLQNRKLQIEYIKRKSPDLARIAWQTHAPFDLYSYDKILKWQGVPARARGRLEQEWRSTTRGRRVRYNWEGQFLGVENEARLKAWLLETQSLFDLVDKQQVIRVLANFSRDPYANWHSVTMLLTLAVFSSKRHLWIE